MPRIHEMNYAKESRPLRVAAYCRVSSDSADQLNSYAAQVQAYTKYIGQHPDWELADIYADRGLTGTKADGREELQRLIRDSRKGKIDRVIVKSVSRFARNIYDSLFLTRQLKGYGVSIFFEEQDIDTAIMNDEILLSMQSMAAQSESMSISQNMRWSYQDRMEKGEYVGTVSAYGYKLVNGTLEIYEPEAEIVRRIFNLYLSGMGKQAIASLLNKEGVPRRYGNEKWYKSTIDYVIQNERYIGDALLQKKYTTEFPFQKKRNNGEVQQYYVENSHLAIISRKIFEAAQKLVEANWRNNSMRKRMPLSGKIYCPDCGHTFRKIITNEIVYWQCAYQASGKTNCQPCYFPEEAVYAAFLLMVNKLTAHRETILKSMIGQLEQMQNRNHTLQSKVYEIDRQIAQLNQQNHILAQHRAKGRIDAAGYAEKSNALNNKVSTLRAERRRLLSEDENDEMLDDIHRLYDTLARLNDVQTVFDESLFDSIVTRITAVSGTELRFRLIGGLELTETISPRERRKTQ